MRVELGLDDEVKISKEVKIENVKGFLNDFMELCEKYHNLGNKNETKTEIEELFADGFFDELM